jgi:hypothetical protein
MITIMLKIKDVEISLTIEELMELKKELDDLLGDIPTFPPTRPIVVKDPSVPIPPYTTGEPLPRDWYKITC